MRVVPCLALFALVGIACGGSSDPGAGDESDIKKGGLPPIALQYVGDYDWVPNTSGGDVQWLSIHRDGTYALHWAMDEQGDDELGKITKVDVAGTQENGTTGPGYPIVLHLTQSHPGIPPDPKTVTIGDCCSNKVTLGLSVEKKDLALAPTKSVGPNESACDATHGSWTDDDADPKTGLYCLCPHGTVYIPSAGGCVK
jgi:hypothetical protein